LFEKRSFGQKIPSLKLGGNNIKDYNSSLCQIPCSKLIKTKKGNHQVAVGPRVGQGSNIT